MKVVGEVIDQFTKLSLINRYNGYNPDITVKINLIFYIIF